MKDEVGPNPLTAFGTASLVTGALTFDTNQALSFPGTSAYFSAADSTSLSDTGSMSIECFLRIPSAPGSSVDLIKKTGSYGVALGTDRKLTFTAVGSGTTNLVSTAALEVDTWYHVVCVCNQDYAGTPQFGKATEGASTALIDDTNGNNKAVSKFTLLEQGLLTSVSLSLQFIDEIYQVSMRAVVYSDSAGSPNLLVTSSPVQVLYPPSPAWRDPTWISFTLDGAIANPGDYHLGYVSDTTGAGIPKAPLVIGCAATGGTTSKRPDDLSAPDTTFGSVVVSNANQYDAYCDYTPIGRSGLEGKLLIYINGALDNSAAHTTGITDTANALEIGKFGQIDDVSFWGRALKPYEIGTHYTAH